MKGLLFATTVVAAATSLLCAAALASAQPGGNSAAADACQQGGYASLVGGAPPDFVSFANTGACVSYAAHGGALWRQGATTTFRVDAALPQWQDTGVALAGGEVAVVSVVNDGGGTCNVGDPGYCAFFSPIWGNCYGICLVSGVPFYSVAGQVGAGAPVALWLPNATTNPAVALSGPGELSLAFNDQTNWPPPLYAYFDNAGYLTATITTYTPIA